MSDEAPYKGLKSAVAWLLLAMICGIGGSGCATVPYHYGHFRSPDDDSPPEIAFEYGEPIKILDRIGNVTGVWSRFLSLNPRVNNHTFTELTRAKLIAYMEENELDDVLVRVNQYDPKGEWRRLRENDRMSPVCKYSFGVFSMIGYTIFPGRVFGGDEYNPYTNTLYLNSDVSAVALHEAAYAKDIHSRTFPGAYAVINEFPLVSLWRRTRAVNDILGYAQVNGDWNIEHETYRVVYPQMGVHSTALMGTFVPLWEGIVFTVAGAAAGHTTGRIAIAQRTIERNHSIGDEAIDEEYNDELPSIQNSGGHGVESDIQTTGHRMESHGDRNTDGVADHDTIDLDESDAFKSRSDFED